MKMKDHSIVIKLLVTKSMPFSGKYNWPVMAKNCNYGFIKSYFIISKSDNSLSNMHPKAGMMKEFSIRSMQVPCYQLLLDIFIK